MKLESFKVASYTPSVSLRKLLDELVTGGCTNVTEIAFDKGARLKKGKG